MIIFPIMGQALHPKTPNNTLNSTSWRLFCGTFVAKWATLKELLLPGDCSTAEEDLPHKRFLFRFRLGVRSISVSGDWNRSSRLSTRELPETGVPGSLRSSLKLVKMACGECWAWNDIKNSHLLKNNFQTICYFLVKPLKRCGRLSWN